MTVPFSLLPAAVPTALADTDLLAVSQLVPTAPVTRKLTVAQARVQFGMPVINPMAAPYNAVGDGVADDTASIQLATTAAAGGVLYCPPGKTFMLSAEIAGVSNVTIWAYGATFIGKAATRFRSFFFFGAVTNVRVFGATFDMNVASLPTYTLADYNAAVYIASIYNVPIYCNGTTDVAVEDCTFKNLYTNAIFCYTTTGFFRVLRNKFTSPVQAQKIKAEHVWFQTTSSDIEIAFNIFDNAPPSSADFGVPGVFTSGLTSTLSVHENTFKYCGRNSVGGHQLGSYSSYGDVAQGDIHHNRFLNNLQQVIRLTICHHMNVHHNYCTMASVAGDLDQIVSIEGTTALGVAPFGCDDIKLHHNTFIDAFLTGRNGVFAGSYDWGYPLKDILITHNTMIGMKYALKMSGACLRVNFDDNHCSGPNGNIVQADNTTVTPASAYGTQAASVIRDLSFRRNLLDGTGTAGSNPINFSFTGYTGTIGKIQVEDNTVQNPASTATAAMVYRGVASGQFLVRRNMTDQYTTGFDLANAAELVLEKNQTRNVTTPLSQSGFTTTTQIGNRYSTGPNNGVSRLVAGTITVSTAEILTGDSVMVSRSAGDGSTQGHLVVASIVNKTSFVINSTSATETSFIFWQIVH